MNDKEVTLTRKLRVCQQQHLVLQQQVLIGFSILRAQSGRSRGPVHYFDISFLVYARTVVFSMKSERILEFASIRMFSCIQPRTDPSKLLQAPISLFFKFKKV